MLEAVWKGLTQSEERSSRNKTRSLQPESLLDSDSKPHHVIQTLKTLVSTLANAIYHTTSHYDCRLGPRHLNLGRKLLYGTVT